MTDNRQSPRIAPVVCSMPFSTSKPRANLDASNDAAFGLAQFFQRTLFSSTAIPMPYRSVWFSTMATTGKCRPHGCWLVAV
jgi:hypothetical protein